MKAPLERLRDNVSEDVYNQVTEILAGYTVYFPVNGTASDKKHRNKQIKYDFYCGISCMDIAKKYGLSVSQVSKIICSK